MGLRINTNLASMGANHSLYEVGVELEGSYRRLSSGLRIATAADDAAGLGISEVMRSRSRSWGAVARALEDGVGMAQTAEGALQEVSNILGRLRELLVRGENGTFSTEDLAVMNQEFQALMGELDRISEQTRFNGISLLSGNPPGVRILADIDNGPEIPIDFIDSSSAGLGLTGAGVGTPPPPPDPIAAVDTAIGTVNVSRSELGASHNRLQSTLHSARRSHEALSSAESRIRDADYAQETAYIARNRIVQQAAGSVLSQANSQPELALKLLTP